MLTNILLIIIALELFIIISHLYTNPFPKLTLHQLAELDPYIKHLVKQNRVIYTLLSVISRQVNKEHTENILTQHYSEIEDKNEIPKQN